MRLVVSVVIWKLFKQAKLENLSKILILEDDLFFLKDFNNHFNNSYEQLLTVDKEWRVLYFGGTKSTKEKISGNAIALFQKLWELKIT